MATDVFSSDKYFWCTKEKLGAGATGHVFVGYNKTNGERVAVKMFAANVDFKTLQREISAVRGISDHENIVKLFEVDEEKRSKFNVIIMELCTGGSLYDVIDSPDNAYGLNENEFKQVMSDVANGLAHLRRHKFSHRDIKPGNIMRCQKPDGTYVFKLADFGTARELGEDETFISLHGTEEYLYPAMYERALVNPSKKHEFCAKVDLWSVGATFFHAATGRLPFQPYRKREDRQLMFEIISTKESGVIYGWQLEPNGVIKYGKTLPPDTQISRGLRALIEPVFSRLMENDFQKMMDFDEFFDSIRNIVRLKVVDVFCVYSCSIHKIYIDPEEPDGVLALKRMIHRQAGIDPSIQELFHENLLYSPRELIPASKLPITTPDRPFFVYGGAIKKTADLEMPVLPVIPQVPKGYAIINDIQFGKDCCKAAWAFRFAAENLDRLYKLMHQVALCYGHTVKHECQLLEQYLQSVEQVNSAICKVLSSQIAGLKHQAELVAVMKTTCTTSGLFLQELSFLEQEMTGKENILYKIQGVLPPLKQKINNTIKVEASTVTDMWDPQLARDIFHRCVDTLQYMVRNVDSSYRNIQKEKKTVKPNAGSFEVQVHEFTKSKLHATLLEAQDKLICLNSGREQVYQKQGEWFVRYIPLRNDICDVKKKLMIHFEDCSQYLQDLEQWEKAYAGRFQAVQENLSLSLRNALHEAPLHPAPVDHVRPEPDFYPSLKINELQQSTGDCSKTVELQKAMLETLSKIIKSLTDVAVTVEHS